ncbi:Hypothetical predicted protein [Marmota monax]|uniref:Uncharacterized protein n=1 Tax=Marmota monax TaxID=9995 RepID=A0A5E4CTZ4_MARMO|nr:Hypothetical predicted protein [Marmota monax]
MPVGYTASALHWRPLLMVCEKLHGPPLPRTEVRRLASKPGAGAQGRCPYQISKRPRKWHGGLPAQEPQVPASPLPLPTSTSREAPKKCPACCLSRVPSMPPVSGTSAHHLPEVQLVRFHGLRCGATSTHPELCPVSCNVLST